MPELCSTTALSSKAFGAQPCMSTAHPSYVRQQNVRHVLLHPLLMLCSVPVCVLALDLRCGLHWRGLDCAPSGHARV